MAIHDGDTEELAANWNLCGGLVAVAAGLTALTQAVEVPLAVRLVPAVAGVAGGERGPPARSAPSSQRYRRSALAALTAIRMPTRCDGGAQQELA